MSSRVKILGKRLYWQKFGPSWKLLEFFIYLFFEIFIVFIHVPECSMFLILSMAQNLRDAAVPENVQSRFNFPYICV